VPFVDVSAKSELIYIRVTVQKTSAKAVSYNWLNESYKVTSSGGLFFNDGFKEHSLACDARQIAQHFLALHKVKITDRFEKLLLH
jgi:SHS2 domain-containing protein